MQILFWVWFIFMLLQMAVVIVIIPTKYRLNGRDLIWFILGGFDAFLLGLIIGAS